MGIGEGLLQGILGGVAGGAGQVLQRNQMMDKEDETGRLEQLRADIQLKREKAIADYKEQQSESKASRINERAGIIAGQRKVQPDDVSAQSDAAMGAYNDALKRGDITEEDAGKAAAAITEYSNKNLVPNTKVSIDDRLQAAMEFDPSMIKQAADHEYNKARDATANKRDDMRHEDSMKRLDAQIKAQDNQFQMSMASASRQAAALENSTARQEKSNEIAVAKLQYESNKTAYEGTLKQITELQRSGIGKGDAQYDDLVKEATKAKIGMGSASLLLSGGASSGGKDFSWIWGEGVKDKTPDGATGKAEREESPNQEKDKNSSARSSTSAEQKVASNNASVNDRIAYLKRIIAAPEFDYNKGLINSAKGSVKTMSKKAARAELDRLESSGGIGD